MTEPLVLSTYCTQSAKEKIDFFIANAVFQHENPDGSPCSFDGRDGGENLAIHDKSDTLDQVVEDWMASPHHQAVILTKEFKYAGYASGVYPYSITSIAMGPGVYNPDTGLYSEDVTEYIIPESSRGKMKAYCLRLTVTE